MKHHFQHVPALVDWAKSHGATLHPSVEVYDNDTTGISFRVRTGHAPLEPGAAVVSCPTGLTLSYLNLLDLPGFQPCGASGGGRVFPARFVAETPPHVLSRLLLMREFEQRASSWWAPYLATLPWPADYPPEDHDVDVIDLLPPFWPSEDRELLDGTNVGVGAEEIASQTRREWAAAVALLESLDAETPWRRVFSEPLYQWACCIFSSRSFRPSLVVPDPEKLQALLPEGVQPDDFSILMPLFDIGNHDVTAHVAWEATGEGCTLKTQTPYRAGEQVYNNYGKKTNAELLLGYGFMTPATETLHNDYVHLRKRGSPTPSADGAPAADYLVSLRPLADPSSVVARARQAFDRAALPSGEFSAFAHVDDALVWGIVVALTTPEQRARLFPAEGVRNLSRDGRSLEDAQLALLLMGQVEPEEAEVLELTVATIYHKIMLELEKLREADFDDFEEGGDGEKGVDGLSWQRRELAREYKSRCRRVLEATLEAFGDGSEGEGEDDDKDDEDEDDSDDDGEDDIKRDSGEEGG